MQPEHWDKLQAAFLRIVDLPADQRSAAVVEACRDDRTLEADLLRLLDEDGRFSSLLDADLGVVAERAFATDAPAGAAHAFGPYTVIRTLGEGGMGVVYLAERRDIGQQAAVKVLKDAWISPSRRDRFAAEQRMLARLNHRSIARLYDADTLPDGSPFFVMEYVEGQPLTEYCRAKGAALVERLTLFRDVCDAVQYAHQQLIVHRDLKPSNILVTRDGVVKLLDFGIAKRLAHDDLPVDQTQALRMMTPQYAAPEQLRGEPVGVHADVYALGVILCELLAGRGPFAIADLTPHDVERVVLDHDPEAPSKVARTQGMPTPVTPSQWADLDVLCLRAVHKEASRRYPNASDLARDVDRFLKGEPLEARADSLGYRASKFVRRHALAVTSGTLVTLLVAGLTGFYTVRLASARNAAVAEAARTQRVMDFMLNLFEAGDKDAAPAADLRVLTLVARGVQEAYSLEQEPALQAELLATLGSVYQRLGDLPKADELLGRALERRRAVLGADYPDTVDSLIMLAQLRMAEARLDDAQRLAQEALDRSRVASPPSGFLVARATAVLGKVYEERGDYARATALLDEAIRLFNNGGSESAELSSTITDLANTHFYAGRLDESDALNVRGLALDRRIYGERHPNIAHDLLNLGAAQASRGHHEEAERYAREAVSILHGWYGDSHPETASAMTSLAQELIALDRANEASELLRSALATQEQVYGQSHPRVAFVLNALGTAARQRNDFKGAAEAFARSLAVYRRAYADGRHQRVGALLSNLGDAHVSLGEHARGETELRDAIDVLTQTVTVTHVSTGVARVRLGRALVRQHRYAEAERELTAGYATVNKAAGPSASALDACREDLAIVYDALGQPEKARAYRDERSHKAPVR